MVRSFGTIGFGSETGLRSAGQNIPILLPISSYQAHHPINLLKRCLLSQMSAHKLCCNLNLSQTATMSGTQCPNARSQDLNKISIKPPIPINCMYSRAGGWAKRTTIKASGSTARHGKLKIRHKLTWLQKCFALVVCYIPGSLPLKTCLHWYRQGGHVCVRCESSDLPFHSRFSL